jgi:hypothetical protein
MREDLDSKIAHDALAEETREHGLPVREQELKRERQRQQHGARYDEARVMARDRDVDDTLRERGPNELKRTVCEKQHE